MKFLSVFAGLLAGAAAVAVPEVDVEEKELDTRQFSSTACVDGVHLISLGGEYTTVGNLSLLGTLADSILNAIPNSEMYQIGYTQDAIAQQDIAEGLPAFQQHFTDYAAKCPKTKIVTIGYSVGAAIVMDTYCGDPRATSKPAGFDVAYRDNLLANIVYGDLTFVSGQRSAEGTCESGEGIVPRAFPGACYPFGRKTKSYCDVNDPQCCTRGGDPNIHFTYPGIYDGVATDFVKAKWNYYKRHG